MHRYLNNNNLISKTLCLWWGNEETVIVYKQRNVRQTTLYYKALAANTFVSNGITRNLISKWKSILKRRQKKTYYSCKKSK